MIKSSFLKLFLLAAILLVNSYFLIAQISQGGTPIAWVYNQAATPQHKTVSLSNEQSAIASDVADMNGMYKIGRLIPVDYTLHNSGTWQQLSDGSQLWRLKITVTNSRAVGLYFKKFWLPENAKVYVYSENKEQVLGAFTSENNSAAEFAIQPIKGETLIIEYFQPAGVAEMATIELENVSFIHRGIESMSFGISRDASSFGDSGNCQININCSEGNNWQDEKRSVVKIILVIGGSLGLCSGGLLNNTAQNCDPIILTADHCGDGSSAANRNQWIFYFNFEAPGCNNPSSATSLDNQTLTGCTLLSRSGNALDSGSDFFLVKANSAVPQNFNPYYAGWDRRSNTFSGGVAISHPSGDIKKIATQSGSSILTDQNGGNTGTMWYIEWQATANGFSTLEGGSSGSPFFDNNGRVRGDASAVLLANTPIGCDNPDNPAIYGSLWYSWDRNGTAASIRLKNWLDPSNSNVNTLDGSNNPCGTATVVAANFSANVTTILEGQSVNFTDLSTGNPTNWNWTFTGGTPASANTQNPSNITYNTAGTYTVTLVASKSGSTDTETKTGYITVLPNQGGNSCDTLLNITATDNLNIYASDNVGYVSGHNGYGDVAKADKFTAPVNSTISQLFLAFGVAKSNSTTRTFNVRIWDNDGANGAPNTVLGTATATYASAVASVTNQTLLLITFTNPVAVSGDFYAGIEFAYQAGDTLALITNVDGETVPTTAWEKFSNNTWVSYDNTNSWGLDVSHYIAPVVCSGAAAVPPVAAFTNTTATVCPGSNVTFTDQSTNSPTSWSWSFPGGQPTTSNAPNPTVTYNTPGTYSVTLTASNQSGNDAEVKTNLIVVRNKPVLSASGNDATCASVANGSATLSVSSGQSPYTYAWANGTTTQNLSNVLPGNYNVTVIDANQCSASTSVSIGFGGISIDATTENVNGCASDNNGSITVTASNAVAPVTYNWSNTAQGNNLFGLSIGDYTVTATDASGCSVVETFTIEGPQGLIIDLNTLPATQGNNGQASASISGGTPPFQFFWSTGETTSSISGLSAGSYTLTVIDGNGCQQVENFIIDLNTGIIENISERISLYPNPNTGAFVLAVDLPEAQNINLELYNILGVKMLIKEFIQTKKSKMFINIQDLPNASYTLKLYGNNFSYTTKIIKTQSY